ncbi:MAG TPA: hypothetical protein VIK11_02605 [Tepidiformaceae bacterium]|jgi:hypothetical protein
MATPLRAKEQIVHLVEGLSEEDALDLLDFIRMRLEPESLTADELATVRQGMKEMKSGNYVTGEEFRKELDL